VRLPAPLTPFIGREDEIRGVQTILRQQATRLVTLTGPGGTGKTRVSLAVAEGLGSEFADGICFVPLATITEATLVAPTIALTLGVKEDAEQSIEVTLQEYLAPRHLLLLLDNFEQVVAAGPLLTRLLATAPRLKVLITSRTVLHVRGEKEVPVAPLPLPAGEQVPPPEQLLDYAAVRLFVARVQDSKADFTLTPTNAEVVLAICRRLEGLPLALQLPRPAASCSPCRPCWLAWSIAYRS
jgi:predicted ATPase